MNKTIKQRKILVPKEDIYVLMAELGASRVSVYNALRFACNSDKAKQIREAALKRGGKEVKVTAFM